MANGLKSVRGVVEATAQNAHDRYGLRVGGEWYDGFGSCPAGRGDEVEVVYSDNGRFHNLKHVFCVEGPAEGAPEPGSGTEKSAGQSAADSRIWRSVALKCAAALCSFGGDATGEETIALAEKFERWLRATSRN